MTCVTHDRYKIMEINDNNLLDSGFSFFTPISWPSLVDHDSSSSSLSDLSKLIKDFNDKYSKLDYYIRYIQFDLKKEMEDKVDRANELNDRSLKNLNKLETVIEKLEGEREINKRLKEELDHLENESKKRIKELEDKLKNYDFLYENMRDLVKELLINKIGETSLDFDNSLISEIRDTYSEKFINLCLLVEDLSNRIKLELLEKDEQLTYIFENIDYLNTVTSKKVKKSFFKKLFKDDYLLSNLFEIVDSFESKPEEQIKTILSLDIHNNNKLTFRN